MNTEPERLKPEPNGTKTILLVEDEDSLRVIVTYVLSQELGYNPLPAGSAEEALTLAESYSGNIDLLLTDVILPGISGSELAGKMLSSHPKLKIIYISGYADYNLKPFGISGPSIVFLQKPFTIKTLAAKIREVLEESGDR